uniref:Uncharacterized protein n=1 Tax=Ditylenchus dipsaci TaxID=166011 RepID=A0A915EEB0_9BILA
MRRFSLQTIPGSPNTDFLKDSHPLTVSRPLPRFGLKANNNERAYCIYALNKPKEFPKGYVEHRVSIDDFKKPAFTIYGSANPLHKDSTSNCAVMVISPDCRNPSIGKSASFCEVFTFSSQECRAPDNSPARSPDYCNLSLDKVHTSPEHQFRTCVRQPTECPEKSQRCLNFTNSYRECHQNGTETPKSTDILIEHMENGREFPRSTAEPEEYLRSSQEQSAITSEMPPEITDTKEITENKLPTDLRKHVRWTKSEGEHVKNGFGGKEERQETAGPLKGIFPTLLSKKKSLSSEADPPSNSSSRTNSAAVQKNSLKSKSRSVHSVPLLSFLGLTRSGTYHVPADKTPNRPSPTTESGVPEEEDTPYNNSTIFLEPDLPDLPCSSASGGCNLCSNSCPECSSDNAIPDLDDHIQTTFKVLLKLPELEELFIVSEISEKEESGEDEMEQRKNMQAPSNPPPPVPNHNKQSSYNGNSAYENGSSKYSSSSTYGSTEQVNDKVNGNNGALPLQNISNQNGHHSIHQSAGSSNSCKYIRGLIFLTTQES